MNPVDLPELPGIQKVIFAKDQPEYLPLPAYVYENGLVCTKWRLSAEELARLLEGEDVLLWIWTMGRPLQPVLVEVPTP